MYGQFGRFVRQSPIQPGSNQQQHHEADGLVDLKGRTAGAGVIDIDGAQAKNDRQDQPEGHYPMKRDCDTSEFFCWPLHIIWYPQSLAGR